MRVNDKITLFSDSVARSRHWNPIRIDFNATAPIELN